MKKTLLLSLLLVILIFICSCSNDFEPEPLDLHMTEWVTHRGTDQGIANIIGGHEFVITDDMELSVKSNDESIVYLRNGNVLEPGDKYGETTVEITLNGKVGILKVKVIRQIDYYFNQYKNTDLSGWYRSGYLAASWLINNLDSFKNPSSVTVKNVYYIDGEIEKDRCSPSCFIMEISAQNSFGGYSTNYFKVTSSSISEATIKSTLGHGPYYYGNKQIYISDASGVNRAVQEHIADN